ncbi:MAG TPA: hypothetical protein VIO61_12940 [Anaerolineaceae bacterium]
MVTTFQNQIDKRLFAVGEVLKDIEFDMEWEYHALLTFSIEWADICGQVKHLIVDEVRMSPIQKNKFDELRSRFDVVKNKLKELDLENPFENSGSVRL